ncbi:MAG: manganese efflux pump MntP family protein [candidate division Zixibacteria bacterium]|nr:manganese efflux pump MntP family protein [candidate division Zixibacteria bacterium]
MNFVTILGIAFGLAMDAFAVAIAVGARLERPNFRSFFRLSFHFGLFQFMMPIVGWLAGSQVAKLVHNWDHWVAFGLLAVIGAKMIYESFHKHEKNLSLADPTRKWSLVLLSIATSIDALAVGLSIAFLEVKILWASIIIGIVAAGMTLIGMGFGKTLGARFGRAMEFTGGIILIAIGIRILLAHMT